MKAAAGISIVLITLTGCILFSLKFVKNEAVQTAKSAADVIKEVLNLTPTVTISSYVTRQKTSEILELASISKEFPLHHQFTQTQLGSTKKLELLGEYTVKAGFDFREPFNVWVDADTQEVHAEFPAPKILSVQMNSYRITKDETGLWNRLTQQDQAEQVQKMSDFASKHALQMDVLKEAKESVRKQLMQLAQKRGQVWRIRFKDEVLQMATKG